MIAVIVGPPVCETVPVKEEANVNAAFELFVTTHRAAVVPKNGTPAKLPSIQAPEASRHSRRTVGATLVTVKIVPV